MGKIVVFIPLCVFVLSTFGCESFLKKGHNKPGKPGTSLEADTPTPKSSGYLSGGATVKVDTGEVQKRVSVLEQFEQTKQDLALLQEKFNSLERDLGSEKTTRTALEADMEELNQQLETTRQLIIENEKIRKKLEESQAPYEQKLKELTLELTKAQIEETKAKQELISLKIESLMEKKKPKSPDSQ